MAQLVLSVTRRHCNQLDTIEGGRRVGGSSSELSLRPHALIFTSTIVNNFFLFTNYSLGIALLQNHFNQPCKKRLILPTLSEKQA